jgi:hypothetical protein
MGDVERSREHVEDEREDGEDEREDVENPGEFLIKFIVADSQSRQRIPYGIDSVLTESEQTDANSLQVIIRAQGDQALIAFWAAVKKIEGTSKFRNQRLLKRVLHKLNTTTRDEKTNFATQLAKRLNSSTDNATLQSTTGDRIFSLNKGVKRSRTYNIQMTSFV